MRTVRTSAILAISALIPLWLGLSVSTGDDAATIQGTWRIVRAEIGGEPFPVEAFNNLRLVLKDGKYELGIDEGAYKLLDAKGNKGIDVIGEKGPNEGKTIPAIYELKGDSMKICYDLSGKTRPEKFETEKGTRQFLATYERVPK